MSQTYVIQNLSTTDTTLREGGELVSMYVSNTSTTEQLFNLKIDKVFVYKEIKIPANVTLHIDTPIYFPMNRVTVSANAADKLDVTYTLK